MIARPTGDTSAAGRADGIVACTIGSEQFALRGGDAREIVRAERMRRCPGTDGAVGTVYVNREMVSVYSLAAALELSARLSPGSAPGGNHIVITRGWTGMAGWLVDRIARPSLAGGAPVIPLPAIVGTNASRWFEGLVRIGDRSLPLLSPANLDPRAPAHPAASDGPAWAPAADAVGAPAETGSPLVLLFSSPAVPPCGVSRFALSARRIAAVIRPEPVTVIPGSTRHVRGVIVWRDVAVPVMDVRAGITRDADDDRFVVCRCGTAMSETLVAFPIGPEVTLHQPTRSDRHVDEGEYADAPFVAGVFNVGGNTVALLDLEAAVAALAR